MKIENIICQKSVANTIYLFDFDGLLVDTEKLHYMAYQQLCHRRGGELCWDFSRFCKEAHGKAGGVWEGIARECPQVFSNGVTREVLYEEKKAIYVELLRSTPLELMPGAAELLQFLADKDAKRAVVTNSPKAHIDIICEALPLLKTIPLWVTREDYLHPKPAPDGYLLAIEKLTGGEKCDAEIIGFEDSLKGLKSLLAAGSKGVLVCPSGHEHLSEALSLGAIHLESL
ncbi:MAG: HAD family phosphatase [Chlamydiota bacterium]